MRIGIFGGTFDPIHRGHVEAARTAADAFELDRVLFVPAGFPPHKDNAGAPYEDRFRMVELACAADPRFEASRLEAPSPNQQRRHYSIDTIEKLRQSLAPGDRLFFLIGRDAFAEIGLWYRWRDVVEAVEFVVVNRPGGSLDETGPPEGARIHRLAEPNIAVASTEIREAVRRGDDISALAPAEVGRYIAERGLYRH